MRMITIHFASSTTHAKCNNCSRPIASSGCRPTMLQRRVSRVSRVRVRIRVRFRVIVTLGLVLVSLARICGWSVTTGSLSDKVDGAAVMLLVGSNYLRSCTELLVIWRITELTHDPRDPWPMTYELWLLRIVCTPTSDTYLHITEIE